MANRKARRGERRDRSAEHTLHLRVTSPRIVFLQCATIFKRFAKILLLLAVIGGAGYYLTTSISRHLLENEKFQLRYFDFQTNGVMTPETAAELAGISLSESIFSVDLDDAEERLRALPQVVSAEVERRIYDTIRVRIVERVPVAWVACKGLNIEGRSKNAGLLVDAQGALFTCGESLWDEAKKLPLIVIKKSDPTELPLGGEMSHKDAKRALDLVNLIAEADPKAWVLDTVELTNFYSLLVTSNDGVKATFGMYDHERQLGDLFAARRHASETGRKLDWINLLPEHNIPGGFKVPKAVPVEDLTSSND